MTIFNKVTYFPILIEYTDDKERKVCKCTDDIDLMRTFKLLKTEYKEMKEVE